MEKLTTCVLCTVGGVARVFLGGPFRSAPWYFFKLGDCFVSFAGGVSDFLFLRLVGTSVGVETIFLAKNWKDMAIFEGWTCFEGRVFLKRILQFSERLSVDLT